MSVEFGPIPLPTSPIQEYFKRKLKTNSMASTPTSTISNSPIGEDSMQSRLAGTLAELAEKPSMDGSISTIDEDDSLLESQPISLGTTTPLEYSVPFSKKLTFLALYFVLNLSLTLSNKAIMQKIKAPWLLTVMHASATSIGCSTLVATGHLKLSKLGGKETLILLGFSSLFTLNIAVSNVSLALVSVPFHQIARSTCPIATVLIYRFVFKRTYERQTYLSMLPLIGGVGLATVGDYYVTMTGFAFTVLGVLLASIKSVTTNRLMTGPLALSPMEVLFRMSPLAAAQCLFYAWISGEFSELKPAMQDGVIGITLITMLAFNATVAFFLNSVSFQTNKLAGALTMSVCGNLKQCLTIVLGIILFSVRVTALNGFGMGVALIGAAWYSRVELQSKGKR